MKKIKILIYLTLLPLTVLFNNSVFCQEESADKQVIQFSTGKDKISFCILDYETNEPLIGASLYSFDQNKILATTDIDGIAITEKGLTGNLEASYIVYYSFCFKLDDNNIDSVMLWLKPEPLPPDLYVIDTTHKKESPRLRGKSEANIDIDNGKIQLRTNSEPSEEQLYYAKNHDFEFNIM